MLNLCSIRRRNHWCQLHLNGHYRSGQKKRKMAKLREEIAVQKAMETELNKTIHITEETTRAKQMLATMSNEIRSPLSGVVSMAEVLATTRLDKEQRQLLDVMISSGDLVLQLINDILDLSKVESGVMKLEATKFRPREVVRHVLQTAAASLKKMLTLEGYIADDVPIEVIGDVRQILTNLVSNATKFTHEGKVGIRLYVVPAPYSGEEEQDTSTEEKGNSGHPYGDSPYENSDELMGGHMTVSSKEHCGSTFTFVLPYRVSPESDDQSDDPDELPDASSHHDTTAADDHTLSSSISGTIIYYKVIMDII
ncbi:hypothetical protein SOVF_109570 [Spinacia oleracea]|nr:hypothetical protein SOVF_109570 [Spinacia oleracea]